jgi:hypothetical protein
MSSKSVSKIIVRLLPWRSLEAKRDESVVEYLHACAVAYAGFHILTHQSVIIKSILKHITASTTQYMHFIHNGGLKLDHYYVH